MPSVPLSPKLLALAVTLGEPMEDKDFRAAPYARAYLAGGVFSRCRFDEADLRGADLREAVFDRCSFKGALMDGARLRRAVLNGCRFDHAAMRGADLHGTVLTDCALPHAQLGQAMLSMAAVSNCDLSHAALTGADLASSTFTGSTLQDVNADESRWEHTSMLACVLTQMTWARARMQRAVFHQVDLQGNIGLQMRSGRQNAAQVELFLHRPHKMQRRAFAALPRPRQGQQNGAARPIVDRSAGNPAIGQLQHFRQVNHRGSDQHPRPDHDAEQAVRRRHQCEACDVQQSAHDHHRTKAVTRRERAGERLQKSPRKILHGDRQREIRDGNCDVAGQRLHEDAEALAQAHAQAQHQRSADQDR